MSDACDQLAQTCTKLLLIDSKGSNSADTSGMGVLKAHELTASFPIVKQHSTLPISTNDYRRYGCDTTARA